MSHGKEYAGRYVGEVVSVDDAGKLLRVKVNVYDIFDGIPVANLPWTYISQSFGGRTNEGLTIPLHVGDVVWVEFIHGDTRRPLIVGGVQTNLNGIPNSPDDAWGGAGKYTHKRSGSEPAVPEPDYYKDVVFKQNNALIQLCNGGNIRITQMTSGSAIELLPTGDIVIHCEGNIYASATGNLTASIQGNATATVTGNVNIESKAVATLKASTSITLNAPVVNIQGVLNTMAQGGGAGTANITGSMNVKQGNVTVSGDVTAGSISLQGHVHGGVESGGSKTSAPQ
jgi:uncharacterized protein involved in type VI secretion and phage assembly